MQKQTNDEYALKLVHRQYLRCFGQFMFKQPRVYVIILPFVYESTAYQPFNAIDCRNQTRMFFEVHRERIAE